MSVNSNPIPHISCELDIVKVAYSLGIDQDRLLAYVYSNVQATKQIDDKELSPDYQS
ncbi:hypothetical protein LOZ80_21470 [Paenibacillus sp. HWE-109]|uniref:hypothetical protein n=1 Tax=Paenibacillus sp. HWE-109 TaxID=1306526 RepID=UPI001EDDC710|nr:hypothetical protein [Paenibacillus sp. HWE-109]UKS24195.1 hypothetical protein LOZ80_21470 [Paenibacillus sp. HWE-109]